jgi:amino acid adenylation domain-containing protein
MPYPPASVPASNRGPLEIQSVALGLPASFSSVPHLIDAQAAETPHSLALSTVHERLSYRELNNRANQLAHYLIKLGVRSDGADSLVALCLQRSPTAVTCALGILKAGAAYLPLDPIYPVERLAFMLRDAQPRVLITSTAVARQLPAGPWQVVAIDESATLMSEQSSESPDVRITSEQLAYVIYTSGSTGRPKGVAISHASLLNLCNWHHHAFAVTSKDRASLLAGVGFDAAVWETWPTLAAGASLHLPDDATRLSPELLRDWLVAEEMTISFLPTALAERVMTLDWPRETALRTLLTGAETLRQFPSDDLPFAVVNNYGPTECAVVATSGTVPLDAYSNSLPTIGRPIANAHVYILDENLQPVPTHVAGEIYIGGAGVARGYLNRPELTAEKFLRDPFNSEPGARMYRTGDLARYLANGDIAYLGRSDEQIKIMGHRIEPNEIVAVLERHPSVRASRVIARELTCEKQLVAYLVLEPAAVTSAAEIRGFLQQELPQYMVPTVFVRLAEFPLTANGKVDQASLPLPNVENTLRDQEMILPRTPVEERVAALLASLLGLEQVSVYDNFFLLGGHSLLGTQLISQIRNAFAVELALRTLFESPTIAQLSREIEGLILARVEAMSEAEVERLLA